VKYFGDISLRWQMLLAPLLLILAAVALGAVNYRHETQMDMVTTRLFDETLHRLTSLDEVDAFALDINGRMFRAMTLVQNGAPPRMVSGLVDSLPSDLDTLGDELGAVARSAGENGHQAEATKLLELSGKYRKSGREFSKVLFIDPSVAVDYATSAGVFFQDLHGILRTVSKSYDEASAAEFASLNDAAAKARRFSGISALLAVIGGLTVSLWLARSLTAPLVELTAVVAALARADWSVTVPYALRGDEVGKMARAVNVFRDNGVEHERLKLIEEEGRLRTIAQQAADLQRDRAEQARLMRESEQARKVTDITERFDATAHKVLGSFATAFGTLQETAATMGSAADATRTRADDVSQAALEASNNVHRRLHRRTRRVDRRDREAGRCVRVGGRGRQPGSRQAQQHAAIGKLGRD
jgi:HAMP domain-containing protein